MATSIQKLREALPHKGRVTWIGLRPAWREPMKVVQSVEANPSEGLVGDHYNKEGSARQVTLVQQEHLHAIAAYLHKDGSVDARLLRRNIVVAGINLLALKSKIIRVGEIALEVTGGCHPCGRMEEHLGSGGYNAVRGHGGVNARVLSAGKICVGDKVFLDLAQDLGQLEG